MVDYRQRSQSKRETTAGGGGRQFSAYAKSSFARIDNRAASFDTLYVKPLLNWANVCLINIVGSAHAEIVIVVTVVVLSLSLSLSLALSLSLPPPSSNRKTAFHPRMSGIPQK